MRSWGMSEHCTFLTVETLPYFSSSRLCLLTVLTIMMKYALNITERMDGTDEGFSYREGRVREGAIG